MLTNSLCYIFKDTYLWLTIFESNRVKTFSKTILIPIYKTLQLRITKIMIGAILPIKYVRI